MIILYRIYLNAWNVLFDVFGIVDKGEHSNDNESNAVVSLLRCMGCRKTEFPSLRLADVFDVSYREDDDDVE